MNEAACLVGAEDHTSMARMGNIGVESPDYTRRPSRQHQAAVQEVAPVSAQHPNASPTAVRELLRQFQVEPTDAEECTAKFSLYEGYASEVETMRNTLFTFHEDARPDLPPIIVTDMDRQLKGIDCTEAMGIPDDSREWFVYHMMRQAERNNLKMASILDGYDKKLKFLASNDQAECPVCLDHFDDEVKKPETLSCCHKVCKECWDNWTAVTRGRPFCPLCRQDEFLTAVATRASATSRDSSDSD